MNRARAALLVGARTLRSRTIVPLLSIVLSTEHITGC